MEKIFDTIEKLIETISNLKLEPPNNVIPRVMLLNLEELRHELHRSNPDKEKVHQIHYGFLRAYQEISNIENKSFHEEVEHLLLTLNSY